MAFDEGLADRIRDLTEEVGFAEKKMFGGLCFMIDGHMCAGIVEDRLMLRVGPDQYDACLAQPYVSKMDFTGRPMTGMIYVEPDGICDDEMLRDWIETSLNFVVTLPPKG